MPTIHTQKILVLDFGSQYSQLIARRIREVGVYCEVHPYSISAEKIKEFAPTGIILSGGPETVTEASTPRAPEIIFDLGCPILGICYGMQTMAVQLGGEVETGHKSEFGYAQVAKEKPSALLKGIDDHITADGVPLLDVWMSHGDQVKVLPKSFIITGSSANCAIAAMEDTARQYYGLQFHPEVSHTRQGARIIEQFTLDICQCKPEWTPKNILQEQISEIKNQVGSEGVLLGLSGGVDSSVAAILLHEAIGDQLTCVFVDTGLLRLNEVNQIHSIFEKQFGIKVICVDAKEKFFVALEGVSDPEQKRKIIGKHFIEVFDAQAALLSNIKYLAQGTIYSDVIESAAIKNGTAHVIKSHHNVGGLPDNMQLKLIEPLRELFKDEVRKIGVELGLPYELVYKHPFPGPGLGVRVLGEVKREYVYTLQLVDAILIEELYKADLYYKVSQAFAVFLPVKSVGVVGDARQYEHVIAIRIVETVDFMTAHWARVPYEFLETISSRIINEVPGISRVTYDISSKPACHDRVGIMFSARDQQWMERALELAQQAKSQGEVPVGAVLVLDDKIIGEGANAPISKVDPTAHAEIIALRQGAETVSNYRILNSTLYVTLEPCIMCAGAMVHARIKRLIYAASDPKAGAVVSHTQALSAPFLNHRIEFVGGLMQVACSAMLTDFFKQRR